MIFYDLNEYVIYNFLMKTFEGEAKLKDLPPITK